jgi:Immunity protein 7
MFEFHGWATIRFTAEIRDRDDEDQLQNAAIEAVQSYVRQMGYGPVSDQPFAPRADPYSGALVSAAKANVVLDVRVVNGEAHLWAAGATNHVATIKQELFDLYHCVARVAPDSYGLLYMQDDEDPLHFNDFQVYALARGALTDRADPFLSPFVPVVEDPPGD